MTRRISGGTRETGSLIIFAVAVEICVISGLAVGQVPATAPPEHESQSYADEYRDAVDASAPHDAKAANRLQLAETLIRRGQFDRALEALLYSLDKADGGMVRLANGRLSPVGEEANRLIGTLPPETLNLYRRQYGPASEKMLEEALASGRRDQIEAVAAQFRHTDAGRKALLHLAAIHFDRAEFGLALGLYERLFDDLDSASRLRMAYTAAASGKLERAHEIAAGLADADLKAAGGEPVGREAIEGLLARAADATPQPLVVDWRMPFGDPTSSALAESGEPILLRRWQQPLAFRTPVQAQVERLTLDLNDLGKATVPSFIPLAIGDRVITRTLHGTSVYSISQGRLLWESEDESLEQRLTLDPNESNPAMQQIMRMRGQFGIDPRQSTSPNEFSPLADTLFRNGVYGHVTADDERLYVVENDFRSDQASLTRMTINRMNVLAESSLAPSFNRLVAYDLESGRLAWPEFGGLGGGLSAAAFEPPLAGYFFFGPPTPGRKDLYVIGEAEKQIRLVALDPESGQERWMRVIAEAPVGISQDPVRQQWPAQVAVGSGVLVCPTTVGWLVGIEQANHSILWATRYAPPTSGGDAANVEPAVAPAALNSRWAPAAPIIHRNRIFFTPPEEQHLVCLDLATGEILWKRGRGEGLYLAGVVDNAVIVVNRKSVDARDVVSGDALWSIPLPEDSIPAGRSTVASDRMYLPLRGDTLLAIDLQKGGIVGQTPLPPGETQLGNLLLHRGTLLSLSPDGLTAFEERSKFIASIESKLEQDPRDSEALLRQAQLRYVDGAVAEAAATLDTLGTRRLSPAHAERVRSLKWDILAAIVRADGPNANERLNELTQLAQSDDERFLVRRLEADRSLTAAMYADAAKGYLSLAESDSTRRIDEENGRRHVSIDAWLSGRLQDVWRRSNGTVGDSVDELIEHWLSASRSPEDQARRAKICRFHPAVAKLELELAERELSAGKIAAGEMRLLRLSRRDGDEATNAFRALSRSARELGLKQDAEYWSHQAEAETLASQDETNDATTTARDESDSKSPWGDYQLTVLRTNGFSTSDPAASLKIVSADLPFYQDRSLTLVPDRLSVSGPNGIGLDRLIPLQVVHGSGSPTVAIAEGHLLFILFRGMLQAVSPLENRLLWSRPVPSEGFSRHMSERPAGPMRSANSLISTHGSIYRARLNGSIAAANASYVAAERRRELEVVDATTGEWMWTRSGWGSDVTVFGTESLMYVFPNDGRIPRLLRAVDGAEVELRQAAANVKHAVTAWGDRLLLVEQEPSLTLPLGLRVGGGAAVSLFDPYSEQTVWKRTYPAQTLFDVAADGRLVVLTPDGVLARLDTATGNPTKLGELPVELLSRNSSVVFLEDRRGAYAIVNVGRTDSSFAGLATVAVNGEIFAFNRVGGDLRWRKEVSHRRLIAEDFGQMPVFLFVDSDRTEARNQNVGRLNLLALDKRRGEAVLDESHLMNSSPVFRSFSLEPERRSIRLTTFNSQLRLLAVEKDAAPTPPAEVSGSD